MGCSADSFAPDLCTFVNLGLAECIPTDPVKSKYDLRAEQMIGYTCLSPEDFSAGKKRARKIIENLD